jgi:hypothetical protein
VSFIAQTPYLRPSTLDLSVQQSAMTSQRVAFPSVSAICAHVKRILGFAAARRIRLYGKELKVASDSMSSVQWGCSSDDEETPAHSPTRHSGGRVSRQKRMAASTSQPSVSRKEKAFMDKSRDQDRGKGATEQAPQNEGEGGNTSMQGQLGHRDNNAELKNADSDLSG